MNKATYFIAALILGFTMSAQAQSSKARTQFRPQHSASEMQAASEMGSVNTMSQRQEVLTVKTIPNPWVTLEPTVGYVSSTFTGIQGTNGASVDAVSRMQAGVNLLVGRGMWQLESGLLYSQRGGQMNGLLSLDGTQKADIDFALTYIDVPVMARFSWPHSSRSHLFARAGVVAGFLTDAKADSKITTNSVWGAITNSESEDLKDSFNSTDIRLALGLGYDWKFAQRMGLIVQADFQESFSKINKDNILPGRDMLNRGIIVSAGFSIKL
ncbi:porin family protein [Bdellovibrio sp. HCB290]|uniref:porin family protein n=1 Tax=Bdellovibrio sp. HCB290 TaxID=3394356 RepID=UPI0039B6227C